MKWKIINDLKQTPGTVLIFDIVAEKGERGLIFLWCLEWLTYFKWPLVTGEKQVNPAMVESFSY
jgi:hypothetical protein